MILSDQERRRFAAYCHQQAADDLKMADQIQKNMANPIGDRLAAKYIDESKAFSTVAMILDRTESQSIGSKSEHHGS